MRTESERKVTEEKKIADLEENSPINLCAEPQFFSKIISTSAKFSVAKWKHVSTFHAPTINTPPAKGGALRAPQQRGGGVPRRRPSVGSFAGGVFIAGAINVDTCFHFATDDFADVDMILDLLGDSALK